VHVFRHHADEQARWLMSPVADWVDGEARSYVGDPAFAEIVLFERWAHALARGDVVAETVRDLRPDERAHFVSSDVRSLLIVPIVVEGEWWGEMGFDDTVAERSWEPAEIEALRAAASIMGAAVGRERAEETLRRSEDRLRQAQKMEGLGRLAGGVAHDFNNLLTAIHGYTELARRRIVTGADAGEELAEIERASERGAALVRRLLAFSRHQALESRVLDLGTVVAEMQQLVSRLVGEDVLVETSLPVEPLFVRGDRGQLEQVILNLAVNARDAMPAGGRLSLAARHLHVNGPGAGPSGLEPGAYVTLEVADTGHGMDEETRRRAFEPFFTTKQQHQGTGLGLATVYGVVEQSGGVISVDSEPGAGSTFTVFLPSADQPAPTPDVEGHGPLRHNGKATVLLAEDEPAVRAIVREFLEERGYLVLVAAEGKEALEFSRAYAGPIDLLVTDLLMPALSGTELAERLFEERPGIGVLFLSGYSDGNVDSFLGHPDVDLLQKPFGAHELVERVRALIDR
jgi:signal transduction histidine kinase